MIKKRILFKQSKPSIQPTNHPHTHIQSSSFIHAVRRTHIHTHTPLQTYTKIHQMKKNSNKYSFIQLSLRVEWKFVVDWIVLLLVLFLLLVYYYGDWLSDCLTEWLSVCLLAIRSFNMRNTNYSEIKVPYIHPHTFICAILGWNGRKEKDVALLKMSMLNRFSIDGRHLGAHL